MYSLSKHGSVKTQHTPNRTQASFSKTTDPNCTHTSHLYNLSRCKRQNKETDKMTDLGRISLMNLPDETIEEVTSFLSFEELVKLRKLGSKRLEECAKRTLKKRSCKYFCNYYMVS